MNLYQLHKDKLKHHDKRHVAHAAIAYNMLKSGEITEPKQIKRAKSVNYEKFRMGL